MKPENFVGQITLTNSSNEILNTFPLNLSNFETNFESSFYIEVIGCDVYINGYYWGQTEGCDGDSGNGLDSYNTGGNSSGSNSGNSDSNSDNYHNNSGPHNNYTGSGSYYFSPNIPF